MDKRVDRHSFENAVAILLTSIAGINFTTFNSVPFALVTNMVDVADVGMYMGMLSQLIILLL